MSSSLLYPSARILEFREKIVVVVELLTLLRLYIIIYVSWDCNKKK